MAIVIGVALAVLSAVVTLYPFFKSRFGRRVGPTVGADASTSANTQPIYDAIRTLQLEYQLGNVPEEQYREQLLNYRLQAAQALWEQDQRLDESEALEAEILTARTVRYGIGNNGVNPDGSVAADASRVNEREGSRPPGPTDPDRPGEPGQ